MAEVQKAEQTNFWRSPAIYAMLAVFLVNVISYADRAILTVLQESIREDLHLSDFQLGLLAGPAFAIFYSVMGLPIARIAERRNRKRIVILAVYTWSTFTAMCGLAQNFFQLLFLRMSVGASEAAAPPAIHSLIADYFPRSMRGRAMALLALGIPLGLIIGGLVGGLVAQATNWRIAFAAIGLPGILIGLLAWKLMYEPERTSDHGEVNKNPLSLWESIKSLWSIPMYRYLLLCAVLSGNGAHAISAFSASYFIRVHDMSVAEAGGILLTFKGAAGMIGTVLSGYFSDKLDKGKGHDYLLVAAAGSLFSALLLYSAFEAQSMKLALALFVVAALFGNMIMSPAFAAIQNCVDSRTRATGAALFLFCVTVPGAGGPVIVGYVSDIVGAGLMNIDVSNYLQTCPGGKGADGVSADVARQCVQSGIAGLTQGMKIGVALQFAAVFAYIAAVVAGRRAVKAD